MNEHQQKLQEGLESGQLRFEGSILMHKPYRHSADYAMITEKRHAWNGDIAYHPLSSVKIKYYGGGRCQNTEYLVCPYCGEKHEGWEYNSDGDDQLNCHACDMPFRFEASFGYGYSTYPLTCEKNMHHHVFCSQYFYKGHAVRIHNCVHCGHMIYEKHEQTLLPWKDEYDDPDYWDPEGKLKGVPRDERKPTPVLDALQEYADMHKFSREHHDKWNPDWIEKALAAHDVHYVAE